MSATILPSGISGVFRPRRRTCGLISETCACRARGHAKEAVRFSKHNRWRSKEMQSVRTARAVAFILLFADGGGRIRASASCSPPRGGGGELRDSASRIFSIIFHTLPFVRTKGNRKTAAVKRFRGRSCAYAESDAYGTFEAIKRSPILNAPSPRPPSFRNRFCRGIG